VNKLRLQKNLCLPNHSNRDNTAIYKNENTKKYKRSKNNEQRPNLNHLHICCHFNSGSNHRFTKYFDSSDKSHTEGEFYPTLYFYKFTFLSLMI
jgi:hypothetical protein